MDGWMGGRWVVARCCVDGWLGAVWLSGWVLCGWVDGWMDEWMDGWMDERMAAGW
jgi:hypothetical protein